MKKGFYTLLLMVGVVFMFTGCGDKDRDYIKEYSKELKKALGDYTYVRSDEEFNMAIDGAHLYSTNYLKWDITYTTAQGKKKTFTLSNLNNDSSINKELSEECIANIEEEIQDIATKVGWDDYYGKNMSVFIKVEGDVIIYPAFTDLKSLVSQESCEISIGVGKNYNREKCRETINEIISYCSGKANIVVYYDSTTEGIDPFKEDKYVDIYNFENGKCILDNI